MRTEGFSSITWSEYDVHPVLAYVPFYFWSYFNPGMSEYHWAQELAVLFGILFLILAWSGLTYVFGKHGAVAVIFLAMGTTYLHFFTEVRMYALVLLLSAIAFSAAVRRFEGMWVVWGSVALFALPLTHYFATMAIPVYLFIAYVLMRRVGDWNFWDSSSRSRVVVPLIAGLVGVVLALSVALAQRARVDGAWFAASTVTSWPSAAMYDIFMLEKVEAPAVIFSWLYVFFLVLLVFLAWTAYKMMLASRRRTSEDVLLLLMGSTVVLPLIGLVAAPLLVKGSPIYHHRFFLVTGWMFATALFVLLSKWVEGWREAKEGVLRIFFGVGVVCLMVGLIVVYASSAHHELEKVLARVPCENVTIVHESPFSALPANVYAREHRCQWRNVVSTKITRRMANGAGFDVMNEADIYWNLTLPSGDYYIVYAAGTVPIDGSQMVIYAEDGVELWKVSRWAKEADASNMSWWVNNVWYDSARGYVRVGDVPKEGCCYPRSCTFELQQVDCTCVYAVYCGVGT